MSIQKVPELIRQLYSIVDELESGFPGRRFTPDGHLVGSIGEVLAAHYYGIQLHTASMGVHDGIAPDGRQVQIKATQGKSVALRSEPEYLLVLSLGRDGTFAEEYNGPGGPVWEQCGKLGSNGQRTISLNRLQSLMSSVASEKRLVQLQRI